jgi:hypothetical protein
MKRHTIPESRENYFALGYFGNPPAKFGRRGVLVAK